MIKKVQLILSLALASVLAWLASPHLPVPAVVIPLGTFAVVLALAERQMRTFSAWRIYGPMMDGGVMLGGLVVLAIELPRVYMAVHVLVSRYLTDTNLESFIQPVSVLITLGSAAFWLLILTYILRALARASSEGRISHLAYRETVVFTAIMLVAGVWEPRGWMAHTTMAAIIGYVLPTLLHEKIPASRQGALWLLMPHSMETYHDVQHFVRRLARKISQQRVVNLVALPSATSRFGGEHLDLGFRLGKAKSLFPTLPIQLRDWLTFVPTNTKALSLPQRELYPSAKVMPGVIRELLDPDDMVIVFSDATHTREDTATRETLANLPAHRSVHINLDNYDPSQATQVLHVRGHVEVNMTSDMLRLASLEEVLGKHLPFRQEFVTEINAPLSSLRDRWNSFVQSQSLSSVWHLALLFAIASLITLATHQKFVPDSRFAGLPAAALLDIAAATMMIFALVSWLRSTVSERLSWVRQSLNIVGLRIPAYTFVMVLAAGSLIYSMFVDDRGARDFLPERISLPLALFLMWKFVPFGHASEYRAAATPPAALISLADINAPDITWRRVFLFVACGMGAVQFLGLMVTLLIQFIAQISSDGAPYIYMRSLTGMLLAATELFVVTYLVLSAVRHRWAPFAPHTGRFVWACVTGALIAEPIGMVLAARLPELVNTLNLFDHQLSYFRGTNYFFMIFGAATGGIVFLQKRGLTNVQTLKTTLWPISIALVLFGLIASLPHDIFVSNFLTDRLYLGLFQVAISYFVFLKFIPILILRNGQHAAPPDFSSSKQKLGYRIGVVVSFALFVLMFAQITDAAGTGYLSFTDIITVAPGRVLLVSTLCAFLVVRLQHYVSRSDTTENDLPDSNVYAQSKR